ncbi:methyltransferase domain-containing protein [Candidatus Rhodobacter oscarellae]|uniref:methyltransferase domain-containing protein n=1 Tax=Candidatus Rhodobacter oscarellae TaxID=1675527 RepID=UPI002E13B49C
MTGWPQIWAPVVPNALVVADDDVLDLQERSHDLVIHAMSLHWASDPVGQLIQCRRALKPDGLFLCILLGGQTLHELRAVLAESETELTGGLSPRVAPMAEIRDLGALLQRAGFALPVADTDSLSVSYTDLFRLMAELRGMGEANALAARLRRPTRRGVFLDAAQRYAAAYATDGGRITATFELITLTGWAPDDSQPQPLRPGSAKARLADALGTEETELPKGN